MFLTSHCMHQVAKDASQGQVSGYKAWVKDRCQTMRLAVPPQALSLQQLVKDCMAQSIVAPDCLPAEVVFPDA